MGAEEAEKMPDTGSIRLPKGFEENWQKNLEAAQNLDKSKKHFQNCQEILKNNDITEETREKVKKL